MKQLLFNDDVQFWFETLRVIGHASYGGADFGEVVATASQITAGDYDSWHDAWLATAERVEAEARAAHPISARDGFLRASTYYRSAEFFLHGNPDDPRIEHAFTRGVACFRSAIAHLAAVEPVEIPYGETTLSGYFYRASGERPKPTLVMHNGFDGSAEEGKSCDERSAERFQERNSLMAGLRPRRPETKNRRAAGTARNARGVRPSPRGSSIQAHVSCKDALPQGRYPGSRADEGPGASPSRVPPVAS